DLAGWKAALQQRGGVVQQADRISAPWCTPGARAAGTLVNEHRERVALALRLALRLPPEREQVAHALHHVADPEPDRQRRLVCGSERRAGRGHRAGETLAEVVRAREGLRKRQEREDVVAS